MATCHILKFLTERQTGPKKSIRCFPEETYGHSRESPTWFNRKFSLQAKGGYQYKFDEPAFKQKFKYSSQKHAFRVNPSIQEKLGKNLANENKGLNNKKKGLLTQFLDNNSWMKQVTPLMGFERGPDARKINNAERQKSIQAASARKGVYIASKTAQNFYSTQRSSRQETPRMVQSRDAQTSEGLKNKIKVQSNFRQIQFVANPQSLNIVLPQKTSYHSRTISHEIMAGSKRNKIRSQRNDMALRKASKLQDHQPQQALITKRYKTIDSKFIKDKMALTTREWGVGKKVNPPTNQTIEKFDSILGRMKNLDEWKVKQDAEQGLDHQEFISEQL